MPTWLKYTIGAIAIVIAIVVIKNLTTTKPSQPSAKPVASKKRICENAGGTWVGGEVLGTCINSAL